MSTHADRPGNGGLVLPAGFPSTVEVIATDLDHTLVWTDYVLRERTLRSLARARAAGLRVIVVTGRMAQSARRVIAPAGLPDPLVCYQGALVAAPDGTWLLHEPIAVDLALEVIEVVESEGYGLNVYVDDELYVSRLTPEAEQYATFQHIDVRAVGPLAAWLDRQPTKLVCIGDPAALDELEVRMKERFAGRLWISKSLPFFLEFAAEGVSKGSGLDFLAARLGFSPEMTVAFGDGENDVELVEWAGFGVAVENATPRIKALADWVCPPAADEGVAQVIDAILDA